MTSLHPTWIRPLFLSLCVFISFNSLAQAPTDLQIDGGNTDRVNENRPVGSTIGTLTTTDANVNDSHSYELVAGAGATDNASFSISGDELRTNAVFDFETKSSYSVRVRTTDSSNSTYEEALTITINNIINEMNADGVEVWDLNALGRSEFVSETDYDKGIVYLANNSIIEIPGDEGDSLGYSYQMPTAGQLSSLTGGNHEILLRIRLGRPSNRDEGITDEKELGTKNIEDKLSSVAER